MKKLLLLISLVSVAQVSFSSCSEEDDDLDRRQSVIIPTENDGSDGASDSGNIFGGDSVSVDDNDTTETGLSQKDYMGEVTVTLFGNNSHSHQSAAVFGDYAFFVTNRRSALYLYSLRDKRILCCKNFGAQNEVTPENFVLYHCNQMTFGVDYYSPEDPFPLLYISQRYGDDYRCHVEVFRIIPQKESVDADFSVMDAQLVQTIYFPQMSEENSLGNVNCAIDSNSRLMYTYSRNNDKSAENYRKCKISCFAIPDIHAEEVFLEDINIKSSFMLGCSAQNMQGGCVKDGKLFIGQGSKSAGYIYLNIVDLKEQKLLTRVDLLASGITWEPEGCFTYNGNIMVSTGKNIWEFKFANEE